MIIKQRCIETQTSSLLKRGIGRTIQVCVTVCSLLLLVTDNVLAYDFEEVRVDVCHQEKDGTYSTINVKWSHHNPDVKEGHTKDYLGPCQENDLNVVAEGKIAICHQSKDGRFQDKVDYWSSHNPGTNNHPGDRKGACSSLELAQLAELKVELCHRNEDGHYHTQLKRWSEHMGHGDDYLGVCKSEHLEIKWDDAKGKRIKINDSEGKVSICHKAGKSGKYVQITVSTSAKPAHIDGHDGDYLGICASGDTPIEEYAIGCEGNLLTQLLDAVVVKNATLEMSDDMGGEQEDLGLAGGHFDLDTSTELFPVGTGTTNKHVHQWDNKNDLTTIDFFDIKGDNFDNIGETIAPDQAFIVTVANASLSPGGVVAINSQDRTVLEYDQMVRDSFKGGILPIYKIGTPSQAEVDQGIRQMSSFILGFNVNAILNGGLIPTNTSCVRDNDPGALGEYRNGALLLQALAVDDHTLDPTHLSAMSGSRLLWESTIFWHWSGGVCYGDADWQSKREQCMVDGSCLGSGKHGHSKAKAVKDAIVGETDYKDDKIYVCHKAGKLEKYVKIHISKSASCAHIGQPLGAYKEYHLSKNDESVEVVDKICVQEGHAGDFLTDEDTECHEHATAAFDYETVTEEEANKELVDALDACVEFGGAYIGEAKTGRINWKQMIEH